MKHLCRNVAVCVAHAACAALLATPVYAQSPGLAVAPPHGLATGAGRPGGGAADALLTAKAKSALVTTRDVHGGRVGVATNQGVVTLSGTVHSFAEKDRAEHAVQGLNGVARVNNTLRVEPGAP